MTRPHLHLVLPIFVSCIQHCLAAKPNCRNPLFRVHWYSRDCKHCPKMLNREPRVNTNLTVCSHWRTAGIQQCCNVELEKSQTAAFSHWRTTLGQYLSEVRTYLAQMMMRQLTSHYKLASAEQRAMFDAALDAWHDASLAFPLCMKSLLRYVAGMICFMCDSDWPQFLYRNTVKELVPVHDVFRSNSEFGSISIASETCTELWGACQGFGEAAQEALQRVFECSLAKEVAAPVPEMDMFFNKPALCAWARDHIAHHPMLESEMATPHPTMPGLPVDAIAASDQPTAAPNGKVYSASTTWHPAQPTAAARLLAAEETPVFNGLTYLMVSFINPSEVRAAIISKHDGLSLNQHLGGKELGNIIRATVDDENDSRYVYFVNRRAADFDEIVQYKYSQIEGKTVLTAQTIVWPSPNVRLGKVAQIRSYRNQLYIATCSGKTYRLRREGLTTGSRTDGEPLFPVKPVTNKNSHEGCFVTGIAVQSSFFWSTPNAVFMGPPDGPADGESHVIFNKAQLDGLSGSNAAIRAIEVDTAGSTVYMVVYFGGVRQSCRIFHFQALKSTKKPPIGLAWEALTYDLQISLGKDTLYIAAPRNIFSVRANFKEKDDVQVLYTLSPASLHKITDIAAFFVGGTDCEVTSWRNVGHCSQTCGGGLQRQERKIAVRAANGGLACPSKLVRHQPCATLKCPAIAQNCLMGQWMNEGSCSASCGRGTLLQRRVVMLEARNGGIACPKELKRNVACNIVACDGMNFVVIDTQYPRGLFYSVIRSRAEHLEMRMVQEVGSQADRDRMRNDVTRSLTFDSFNRYLYTTSPDNKAVLQWSYSIGDGAALSSFTPLTVWGGKFKSRGDDTVNYADDGEEENSIIKGDLTVKDMSFSDGGLYLLTAEQHVLVLPQVELLSRTLDIVAQVLYKDVGQHLGKILRLTSVGSYLIWSSALHAVLGSTHGRRPTTEVEEILTPSYLHTLAGSGTVEIADIKVTWDGADVFLLVWDTSAEALGLYVCAVTATDKKHSRQLRFTWPHSQHRLYLSPIMAFVYEPTKIWGVPLDVTSSAEPVEVWKSASTARISTLSYMFVQGSDCLMSAWRITGPCSKSCGGGILQEARTIQHEPTYGGQACPSVLSRSVTCNMQPCPENCHVGNWLRTGSCSKPCGGGLVKETRQILHHAAHGGIACPDLIERTVSCNTKSCSGVDCVLSDWEEDGSCSKTCGGGLQRQRRVVLQHGRYGGKSCKGHALDRKMSCNLTPCPRQGFDPIAAGKLTGFNFDVAQYCEEPDLCATLEAVELVSKPPTSSARNRSHRWLMCAVLIFLSYFAEPLASEA